MTLTITDDDTTNEALLIHEIARQMRTCFDRKAQHLGLTRSQWRVLSILRRQAGIRQTQLAEMMEVEPITLGRLLDRMEKSEWIRREADPTDRRANRIYLGTRVSGIVQEMMQLSLALRQDFLKDFSESELTRLIEYLQRIKANVARVLTEEDSL